jgi:hypothetical protein
VQGAHHETERTQVGFRRARRDHRGQCESPVRCPDQGKRGIRKALQGAPHDLHRRAEAPRRRDPPRRRSRARAEEQARAQRKLAQEAEERRLAAEREGNSRAAAAAAAEAAKATEKAASVVENAEVTAQEAILTAAAAPTAPVVEVQKIEGFSTRSNWIAELTVGKTEEQAVLEIAGEIAAGRRDLAALLQLDMTSANRLAKALKSAFNVPCLRAVDRPVAASRR